MNRLIDTGSSSFLFVQFSVLSVCVICLTLGKIILVAWHFGDGGFGFLFLGFGFVLVLVSFWFRFRNLLEVL